MLLNYEIMRVCSLEKGIYVWTIGIDDSKRFGEPNFSEASMMVDSVDFHERSNSMAAISQMRSVRALRPVVSVSRQR